MLDRLAGSALPLLAVLVAATLASSADADLTPVSQTRSLDFWWIREDGTFFCLPPPDGCTPIDVTHAEDQGDDQAPDFSAFAASLGGIVALDSSALGPQGFSASASHAGSGSASFSPTGAPFEYWIEQQVTESNANLSYTFSVDEPTPYRLTGQIETGGAGVIGEMLARIRLEGPGAQELLVVELVHDTDCFELECLELGPEPVDVSGTLLPGTYTVEASLHGLGASIISLGSGVSASNYYHGSFQVALTTAVDAPGLDALTLAILVSALAASGRRLTR